MFNSTSNNTLINQQTFQMLRGETISRMDAQSHKTNKFGDLHLSNQKAGDDNKSSSWLN